MTEKPFNTMEQELLDKIEKGNAKFEPEGVIADYYVELGNLYLKDMQFLACETAYKTAEKIKTRAAAIYPKQYEPELAALYNLFGWLYHEFKMPRQEEEYYLKALNLLQDLFIENPSAHRILFARVATSLGGLYAEQECYGQAREMYQAALTLYRQLVHPGPHEETIHDIEMLLMLCGGEEPLSQLEEDYDDETPEDCEYC